MTTQLERLLFAQGGQCFFCRKPIAKADASVEHLVASANGGANDEGNCVACCKALNGLLGARSIKDKLQIVLNQRGHFQCPATETALSAAPPTPGPAPASGKPASTKTAAAPAPTQDVFDLVLTDLKRRGDSRPARIVTLRSSIKALLKNNQKPNSDGEVERVIAELQKRGKVVMTGVKVGYRVG